MSFGDGRLWPTASDAAEAVTCLRRIKIGSLAMLGHGLKRSLKGFKFYKYNRSFDPKTLVGSPQRVEIIEIMPEMTGSTLGFEIMLCLALNQCGFWGK